MNKKIIIIINNYSCRENILSSNENMGKNISYETSTNTTISSFSEVNEINILDTQNHNLEISTESEIS